MFFFSYCVFYVFVECFPVDLAFIMFSCGFFHFILFTCVLLMLMCSCLILNRWIACYFRPNSGWPEGNNGTTSNLIDSRDLSLMFIVFVSMCSSLN